ncbi:MAG: 16S rRNA (adenine(1518)-N(6)/adenine(1519)-N(6))-dimethyltransferase RsmA [Deltaproteobacteria bacterium]
MPKNDAPSPKKFFLADNSRPKKSFGQNFLRDRGALERIGQIAELTKDDDVLEIGAGLGALTIFLAERAKSVVAIEKDTRLIERLTEATSQMGNVRIVVADALLVNFRDVHQGGRMKVVSNLPYSVSTPILMKLLEERDMFSSLVLMVQREVGQRLAAPPGGRDYGSISVLVQAFMDVALRLAVPPEAFWPRPKVHSVVLRFAPLATSRIRIADEKSFRAVVRASFSARRKMLVNSLSSAIPKSEAEEILKLAAIDGRRRAETLSIEEFGRLAEEFWKLELKTRAV